MPGRFGPSRQSMTSRINQGASLLGIPADIYEMHLDAGEHWCGRHKAWHPIADFSTVMRRGVPATAGYCRRGRAEHERDRSAAKKQREEAS